MEEFFDHYLVTALWSSTTGDDAGTPLDRDHSPEDIPENIRQQMREDCEKFYNAHHEKWQAVGIPDDTAGHDFWLTRNGHGCGYWDGDYPEPQATQLTEASKTFGEYTLIAGSDGQIDGWKGC
jgi:hypothetical protein